MIKKSLLIVVLISNTLILFAQDLSFPRIGAGMQASLPVAGLSVKADLAPQHSAQVVIGLFGPFSSYSGRYAYNFNEHGNNFKTKPYIYGQAGIFKYDFQEIDLNTFQFIENTEEVFGFGVGAGMEWHYAPFSEKLRFNLEIGYGKVDFKFYDFKAISFGSGIHYYFNL